MGVVADAYPRGTPIPSHNAAASVRELACVGVYVRIGPRACIQAHGGCRHQALYTRTVLEAPAWLTSRLRLATATGRSRITPVDAMSP